MAINVTPTNLKGESFPVILIVLIVGAVIIGALALFFFLRPSIQPSPAELLDRFLPAEAPIRQIEAVDLDVTRVTDHPAFMELRESVPLPLRIPATGKDNLFF